MDHVFQTLLKQLKIKYDKSFTKSYINRNPLNNNLWGLSTMLSDYDVDNVALRIENKNDIDNLDLPFVALVNNDFSVVKRITKNTICYIYHSNTITIERDEFFKRWSGVVLLPQTKNSSIEPNYKKHHKKTMVRNLLSYVTICIIAILLSTVFVSQKTYLNIGLISLLMLNITGLYITYLLLCQENHLYNKFGEKMCSIISNGTCNHVLNSQAAKFMGTISWSEIGAAYFFSNILTIMLFPESIHLIAYIGVLVLPYTFWSLWFQKFKVKQWCVLCLITQLILWVSFIICFLFGFMALKATNLSMCLCILALYSSSFYVINFYINSIKQRSITDKTLCALNILKWNKEIFNLLLAKEAFHKDILSSSSIVLGNQESEHLITILSDPYCGPCAKLEDTVSLILKNTSCRVQYIFVPWQNNTKDSARVLISALFNSPHDIWHDVISEWFEKGRFNSKLFEQKYQVDVANSLVVQEYEQQQQFVKTNNLNSTPTIFFNGYIIPYIFLLDDIYRICNNKI